jgi:alkanesulfonate monooxygenase SsuD/methylene tetrahydromethanopterin reductase-like flavin-dependent oxidoreductase (luciferase family)
MINKTEVIETAGVATKVIGSKEELTAAVAEAAQIKLALLAAEARQQAAMEAAKEAFERSAAEDVAELAVLIASIEAAAAAHKEDWFPRGANGKRKKTLPVLDHKIAYRASSVVDAEKMVGLALAEEIDRMEEEMGSPDLTGEQLEELVECRAVLARCVRYPLPELNKDAVKDLPEAVRQKYLAPRGVAVREVENFSVQFNFQPQA